MLAKFGQDVLEVNDPPPIASNNHSSKKGKSAAKAIVPKVKEKKLVLYVEDALEKLDIRWAELYDKILDITDNGEDIPLYNTSEFVRGKIVALKDLMVFFGFTDSAFDDCTPNLIEALDNTEDPADWEGE